MGFRDIRGRAPGAGRREALRAGDRCASGVCGRRGTRCPRYVRGVTGVVEAVRGRTLPDIGPLRAVRPVYAVAFASDELFGPSSEGRWTVGLDLFEGYLEAE